MQSRSTAKTQDQKKNNMFEIPKRVYAVACVGLASVALSGCVGCMVETGQSISNQVQEGLDPALESPNISLPNQQGN